MRQVILDTETTGLDPNAGHRVIEIGCIELVNRRVTDRTFHVYINPERPVDPGAYEVHGIGDAFLADKPKFSEIADAFMDFVRDAEVIAHNAPFDVGFLNAELKRLPASPSLNELIAGGSAIDTLAMARQRRPGKRNSLDALCRDFKIDASERTLHGALLDAELLSRVYLAMTREQSEIFEDSSRDSERVGVASVQIQRPEWPAREPLVVRANAVEQSNHHALLDVMRAQGPVVWDAVS